MSIVPAVDVASLTKRYGDLTAVDELTFSVPRGLITAILGPNGAGKTTTVECCVGFRRPDTGSVRVLGNDPVRAGPEEHARVGVMLQEAAGLHPGARPRELLRHLCQFFANPLRVDTLIERLALGPVSGTPVRRLSGGERHRLALAAALVGRPEIAFLDEPTAGLDPAGRRITWQLVDELRADGVTVVLTTHLIDEAERLADHVVIVDHGRLVAEGSPSSLTGSQSGSLQFDAPAGIDLAALRSALPPTSKISKAAARRYRIDGPVDEIMPALMSWCDANGVVARNVQLSRHTLEDVFLELTGPEATP